MQGAGRLVNAGAAQAGEVLPDVVGAQPRDCEHPQAHSGYGAAGDDGQGFPQHRVFQFAGHILFNGAEDAAQGCAEVNALDGYGVLQHRLPVCQMAGLVLEAQAKQTAFHRAAGEVRREAVEQQGQGGAGEVH